MTQFHELHHDLCAIGPIREYQNVCGLQCWRNLCAGRDCNYFTESRQSGLGDPGCGVTYLEEFEPDDSFVIRRGQYSGPKVISEQEDEDDDISRNY